MDHSNDINNNIASAYLKMLRGEVEEVEEHHEKDADGNPIPHDDEITEDNTNDKSDDGDGMDKVQPKALKKKFKNRKDKDIDNDGDEDGSDEYLHNRRKTVSKAIDTDDESDEPAAKTDRRKKLDKKDGDADVEAEGYSKKMKKEELQARPGTKAQQRAFDKADKAAKPKDKVSLKPMPASLSIKMKDESIGRTAGNSYHNLQKAKRMAAKDGHDYDKLPAYDRTHDNHRDYYDNKAKTTKEDKAPSYLMKRIQEKANHVPQDETRDSFDKQVAGRRLTKTFNNELESQMTEQEFVDMHNPKNADVPEFTNAPVVHAKTFKSFKDSVKAGPKRSGDNDQGDKNVINPVNRNT
jgi:hypothetical protein